MIVVLKHGVEAAKREQLIDWLKGQGLTIHISEGEYQTVLGLVGDTTRVDMDLIASLGIVDSVKRVTEPFKCCNRKFHPDDTVVDVGGVKIGGGAPVTVQSMTNTKTEDVKKTVELINKLVIGTPINEVSEKLEYEVKPIIKDYVGQYEVLYNTFYDAFHEFTTEKTSEAYFGGRTNMLKQPEFSSIDKVKEILSKFEDIDSISKMKEEDNGINIYVGSETELTDDVSVIKTKYNIDGTEGTIAIIGPKRMEYDRVVTLLDYIKNNLGGQSGKEE